VMVTRMLSPASTSKEHKKDTCSALNRQRLTKYVSHPDRAWRQTMKLWCVPAASGREGLFRNTGADGQDALDNPDRPLESSTRVQASRASPMSTPEEASN
jgi:hypothetical protein